MADALCGWDGALALSRCAKAPVSLLERGFCPQFLENNDDSKDIGWRDNTKRSNLAAFWWPFCTLCVCEGQTTTSPGKASHSEREGKGRGRYDTGFSLIFIFIFPSVGPSGCMVQLVLRSQPADLLFLNLLVIQGLRHAVKLDLTIARVPLCATCTNTAGQDQHRAS